MTTIVIIGLILYFLPALVASINRHRQTAAIGALNLFLGWTFIGWVIALVWALTDDKRPARPSDVRLPWWPQDEAPPTRRHYRRIK